MNGLELSVEETDVNEVREFDGLMDVLLPLVQRLLHFVRRRRNETRVSGGRAAPPVLSGPEFTRRFVWLAAPDSSHEVAVDLSDEPQ